MKFKSASYLLLILASALVFSSCLNRPREVLNRRAMERLMLDVLVAEATMGIEWSNFSTPEIQEAFMRDVFRQHRVTQAQWNASLDWYSDRIDIFLQMNDSVMARLQRARIVIENEIARRQAWEDAILASFLDTYIPSTYAFWTPSARSGFVFRFDSLQIAERFPYAEFSFRFHAIGIPPTIDTFDFRAVLRLEYADTTIFVVERITENIAHRMPISRYIERDSLLFAADSIQFDTLRHLSGFVRLSDMHRKLTTIQLFNIALGVEKEEEYEEETGSRFSRLWQRIFGNRQTDLEEEEGEEEDGGDADFFFDATMYQYQEEDS